MGERYTAGESVPLRTRAQVALGRTVMAGRGALRRRDSGSVFLGVAAGYLLLFLVMLENLSVTAGAGVGVTVVDTPLTQMIQPAPGAFLFEPVALVEGGVFVLEFAPLNGLLGLGIALLVGMNLAVSYLAITQPRSCGISTSAGVFASLPALLAGSACCAPMIFLVLGIQVTSTLITAFSLLLPVSVGLLVGTLIYLAGKVSPAAVTPQ